MLQLRLSWFALSWLSVSGFGSNPQRRSPMFLHRFPANDYRGGFFSKLSITPPQPFLIEVIGPLHGQIQAAK